MANPQHPLSYQQQLKATIMISVAFMMIFMSYTAVEGIVTKFYQSNGHEYYGRISLITIYLFFGFSTTYSSSIIKALGYKKVFIGGALCYTILSSTALIIYFTNNQIIVIMTIISTSILCGCASGFIWVAQNAYLGEISSAQNLSTMFSIFEGLRSISQIIGFLLTFYVFKYYDGFRFFSILIPIGLSSLIFFYFLPITNDIKQNQKAEKNKTEGFQKIKNYFELLKIPQNYQIYIYECLNSVTAAISSVFTFKIVDSCVDQQIGESKHDYNDRLTYLLGFALLWNGIGRCLFSFLTKKITDYMNCFQFCYFSALCCVTCIIFGTASYYLSSLLFCCIFTFLIGVSYATARNSCNILLKEVFKNDLNLIGINYFVSSMSFIANVVVITVLTKISIGLCLLAYFVITIYCAYCTKKFPVIKGKRQNQVKGIQMKLIDS